MNRRREALRVAGWLAVVSGAAAMVAAALTENRAVDLAGAYGLLFVLTGAWTVIGLWALERRERATAERRVATASVPNQTSVLGR